MAKIEETKKRIVLNKKVMNLLVRRYGIVVRGTKAVATVSAPFLLYFHGPIVLKSLFL